MDNDKFMIETIASGSFIDQATAAEYAAKREAFRAQIIEALGINPDTGSVYITQVISEIFTLVYMRKV